MDEPITQDNEGIMFPDPASPPAPAENGAFVDPTQSTPDMKAAPIDFANMTPEEAMYRQDIERKFGDLRTKNAKADEMLALSETKIEATRKEILSSLFSLMLESGVDPNNPESMQEFFQELEYENPDLMQMFEIGINAIAGTPGQGGKLVPDDAVPADPAQPPTMEQSQEIKD